VVSGLLNCWPINNDLFDYIGNAHLSRALSTSFSTDRNSAANSALLTQNGFFTAPPGNYFFGTQGTLTLWFLWVFNHPNTNRLGIMDCGNYQRDNVALYLVSNGYLECLGCTAAGSCNRCTQYSGYTVPVGFWVHIALTISGSSWTYYVNGVNSFTVTTQPFSTSIKNLCVFGWNQYDQPSYIYYATAKYDMIRIYNRSLSMTEVIQDMNN
jgi:hypothetical protein